MNRSRDLRTSIPRHALPLPALLLIGALAACSPAPPDPEPRITPGQRGTPAPPPPVQELEVTVEGQTELREASLFESPQGYAIHVLPQLTMTQEEPCCDLAWAKVDDGFFMRIERIDPDLPRSLLEEQMALALSSVGPAETVPAEQVLPPRFHDAELFMRARGEGITSTMLVAWIDGGRYRITLHMPHREAAEGIGPSMWAMLSSLRTTAPRPRP